MKYILGTITALLIILSFTGRKCEHVFTQVEQAVIEIKQRSFECVPAIWYPPSGRHEGNELICVKCFYKQKQIIDYGNPTAPAFVFPQSSLLNCCDTLYATSLSEGALFSKADTLMWSK